MKKLFVLFALILVAIFGSYFYVDLELLDLNAEVRSRVGGSFIKLPSGFTHYSYDDSGIKPSVVLIHGYSSPQQTWNYQIKALSDSGFNVLSYDLYGRGYSDRPELDYNLNLFSEQLDNLLKALEIETSVNLVGLSLGSHIAAQFAIKYPKKVNKIVLLNPQITSLENPLFEIPLIGEYLMKVRVIPSLKYYPEQKKYKGFCRALLSTTREISGIDPIVKYKKISHTHQVAMIWGKQAEHTDYLLNARRQHTLRNISFFYIENAGHAAHFRNHQLVNQHIIDFLSD